MNNDVNIQAPSETERRKAAALVQVRVAEIQLKFTKANVSISATQARKFASLVVENAVHDGSCVRLDRGDDEPIVVTREAAYDLMVGARRAKVSLGTYVDRELRREEPLFSRIESNLESLELLVRQLPPKPGGLNWRRRDEIRDRCVECGYGLGYLDY